MSEPTQLTYSLTEMAEMMIRKEGIHDGHWGIYVRFGLFAANATMPTGVMQPTALVPIQELGIQRFNEPNSLTVDAAKVNPAKSKSKRIAKSKAAKRQTM